MSEHQPNCTASVISHPVTHTTCAQQLTIEVTYWLLPNIQYPEQQPLNVAGIC